jgi:asparagine synthase (glutamine-hydrolysing)
MSYKGFTISFNGAIYNYKELRKELEDVGHTFKTESDTEVILHAYEEFGAECLHRFNGMWAFVIHDASTNKLFVTRDRFSIKPLYYYHDQSDFFIASEVKQFKTIEGINLSYNKKRIVEFLQSGGFKNFDFKTFYNEIFQLEGGTYMIFNLEDFTKKLFKYYDFEDDDKGGIKADEELKSLIKESIALRKRADVPYGLTLSGGLDSCIIGQEVFRADNAIKSYSYIAEKDYELSEERYVNAFLDMYPHTNHQIIFPESIERVIKECIYFQDEPPASLSAVAQFLVYKLAKNKGEKVLLSGQGADEVFGGYPRFFGFIPKIAMILYFRNTISLFRVLKKNRVELGDELFNFELSKKDRFNSSKEYSKYLMRSYGLRDLLHYEDRNSMASSIESRLPYLDYRIVERGIKSRDYFKFQLGRLKGSMLNAFKEFLPNLLFKRIKKLAFDTPEKRLLDEGFFSIEEELNKLKNKFPDLPWNDKLDFNRINVFTAWQVYFLNLFIDSDSIN